MSLIRIKNSDVVIFNGRISHISIDFEDQDARYILLLGRGNYRTVENGGVVAQYELKGGVTLFMWM